MNESDENIEIDDSVEFEFGLCPSCRTENFDLEIIDDFTKDALKYSENETLFDAVCSSCLDELKGSISQVGRHKAEAEQKTAILKSKWAKKLEILKTGRSLMSQKIYSEARKYYEEYIEILEATYKTGPEGINPLLIPSEQRQQECTVLCHLYFDLIYVYDQFENGTAKLKFACDKLKVLLQHSRGQSQTVRKIKKYTLKAKNPVIISDLYKHCKNAKGGCFVATAVFTDKDCSELSTLRNFRDHVLKNYPLGRSFIYYYYKHSPCWINKLNAYSFWKAPTRWLLKFVTFLVRPFC